jgi:hypothetical protein
VTSVPVFLHAAQVGNGVGVRVIVIAIAHPGFAGQVAGVQVVGIAFRVVPMTVVAVGYRGAYQTQTLRAGFLGLIPTTRIMPIYYTRNYSQFIFE